MTEQEIIKKIIAAVPEIVKLKFGCRVLHKGIEKVMTSYHKDYKEIIVAGSYKYYIKIKEVKILGRPITLEDVLVAINKTKKEIELKSKGILFYIDDKTNQEIINWKLNKPFHEQSDETKELIGNLLT